jgi:hypothetical protein
MTKKYVIVATISAIVGAGVACGIMLPILGDASARADERERAYNDAITTLDDSRRELDEIRDSLDRAEIANRELTNRLASATDTTSRGIDTSRAIAIGVDGDLDELAIARGAIRSAIETASRLSPGDGGPNQGP